MKQKEQPPVTIEAMNVQSGTVRTPSGLLPVLQIRLTTRVGSRRSQTGPWLSVQLAEAAGLIQALQQGLDNARAKLPPAAQPH